jgi:hypothetical protein
MAGCVGSIALGYFEITERRPVRVAQSCKFHKFPWREKIPAAARDFSLQNVQTCSWVRPVSYSVVVGLLSRDKSGRDAKLTTYFFSIKSTEALISQIYFVKKIYMFRAVPLPIIRSFPLYIWHWYMSSNMHDIHQCRLYSGKLPMMGRGTVRNM